MRQGIDGLAYLSWFLYFYRNRSRNATGQGIGKHNNFQMRRMGFNQF